MFYDWLSKNGFERFNNDTWRISDGYWTLNIHDVGHCYHSSVQMSIARLESANSTNIKSGLIEAVDSLISSLEYEVTILKKKREKLAND